MSALDKLKNLNGSNNTLSQNQSSDSPQLGDLSVSPDTSNGAKRLILLQALQLKKQLSDDEKQLLGKLKEEFKDYDSRGQLENNIDSMDIPIKVTGPNPVIYSKNNDNQSNKTTNKNNIDIGWKPSDGDDWDIRYNKPKGGKHRKTKKSNRRKTKKSKKTKLSLSKRRKTHRRK